MRSGTGWLYAALLVAFAAGAGGTAAIAGEPYLAQATAALQQARGYLSATHDNKNGYPKEAIAAIDRAEAEIRAVTP